MKDDATAPIDHSRVTDGFAQLRGHKYYVPLATYCGICDDPVLLSPHEQKYLLEIKGIPVKFLQRGAAYCPNCAKRRARINHLARGDRWRSEANGAAELAQLRLEEQTLQAHSRQRFRRASWPYGAA